MINKIPNKKNQLTSLKLIRLLNNKMNKRKQMT